jgi:hypothetical protein
MAELRPGHPRLSFLKRRQDVDARDKPAHDDTFRPRPTTVPQCFNSSGTFSPLAASLVITCLCSQIFMLAESLSPFTFDDQIAPWSDIIRAT